MLTGIILFIVFYVVFIQGIKNRITMLENKVTKLEGGIVKSIESSVESLHPAIGEPLHITDTSNSEQVKVAEPVPAHTEDFGSMLAKIGVAILILGVGFFLNYINSRGLISNNIKFILGLISGGIMIGVAEYVKERFQTYAQILRGGGFVVWFLSIFIGSMIYNIFSIVIALMLTAGIVTVSFFVSLREKEETTFLIGTLGAYLVPLIAGFYAQDVMSTVYVLWYVSIINIGIILIAQFMDWIRSMTIGFVFSWLTMFSLYGDMDKIGWNVHWLFVTICGLTYLIAFTIRDIKQSRETTNTQFSIILTVLNTGIYSVTAYNILYATVLMPYLGFLIALLAVVHFVVYLAIIKTTQKSDHPSALTHLVLAIVMITAAIPLQFDGPLVTMIWFIEGVIVSYLATLEDFKGKLLMYALGLGSIIAGIVHMNLFGEYVGVQEGNPVIFNQQYLVWLFVIVLTQGIAYIWKGSVQKESTESEFKKSIMGGVAFLVLLGQLCFVGLTVYEISELKYFKTGQIYTQQEKELTEYENYYGNTRQYDIYGDLLPESAEQQQKIQDIYEASSEQIEIIDREFSFIYIIFFTIMTVIYLMIGLLKNNILIRRLGIVALAVTLIQLFGLAWSLGPIYRIASFVGIGVILLIVSYLYVAHNKNKNHTGGVIVGLVLVLSMLSGQAEASRIDSSAWTHAATFSAESSLSQDGSWYIAPVDASVWSKSAVPNQADIRIINTEQEEIPYVIVKQGAMAKIQNPIQNKNGQAKILENTLQSNNGVLHRIIVVDTGKEGQVYTGMSFARVLTSQNFRKAVRVYVSDTVLGSTSPAWREVEQKKVVYNYVDPLGFSVEDMDINFPNMASRYIKIAFEDDAVLKEKGVSFGNQIQVQGVSVIYEQRDTTSGIQIKNYISGNFDFADITKGKIPDIISEKIQRIEENTEKKSTEIYLTNIQAATSLTLHVDPKNINFNRDITIQGSTDASTWQTVTTGQIYRIDSPIFVGESLKIVTPVITYPYVRIVVQNNNDTPLTFENIVDITTQKIGILFKAEGIDIQSLTFLIGNKQAVAPSYEIQKTVTYFDTSVPSHVFLSPIAPHAAHVPEVVYVPFGEKYKYLLNISLIVFVALLGYLGYTWTRKV